jgi:hypothetical protein
MLEQIAHYNKLSPKLREVIEKRIEGFGEKVSYRFNISHDNPDPEKYNGAIVWPFMYVLDPAVFRIQDPYEDRKEETKTKLIAMVDKLDEKGMPSSFFKIKVLGRHKGIYDCDLTTYEGRRNAFFLELHPKMTEGDFMDKSKQQIFSRIDEQKEAATSREKRGEKKRAVHTAENLSDREVKDFAAAMLWDESAGIESLRDKTEAMAETNPDMFTDLIKSKNVEYQSMIKRALDKQIIAYNPSEFSFLWASNSQPFAQVSKDPSEKNHVQKLADWLQSNGNKSDEVFKKIKSLTKV